ncbi:MAG: PBP1A family penicillin-binding protein [Deltaproteobacteria bacterium]|nr:PBP1A family penicillin-binding protein [Deltaproteobacteria bacterium]
MRKTRRKKTRSKKKWWIALAVVSALGLSAVGGTYYYVDRRVAQRIAPQSSGLIPAIYSDSFLISKQHALKPPIIREQLLKRHYLEVTGKPEHPGEFTFQPEKLNVITREFLGMDGKMHPSQHATIAGNGSFQVLSSNAANSFELEPVILATLGSGEVEARNYKKLQDIPKTLINAVLAIEDERFYDHFGIDLAGILRAIITNVRAGAMVQGGSTITQQLAKNAILTSARTLQRKFLELFAALSLEQRLSKDQILERYLNEVYLGQEGAVSIHGVAEAASTYFGKKLDEISLPEAALLAGIIKGPSYYSPRKHIKRALIRRDLVLTKMLELKMITPEQYQAARRTRIVIAREGKHKRSAPYYIAALKKSLDSTLNIDAALLSGLTVHTGLNPDLQACAEQALTTGLATLEKEIPSLKRAKQPPLQAALVSIEPYSGKIRAWVGGRDFSESQFNHVSQASRQIGSTIKPFLYLTALDPALNSYKVATATSILSDTPQHLTMKADDIWEPENYDHEYRGNVTLRYALENSLNMPAIYVSERVGIKTIAENLRRFHVAQNVPAVPALALGALDTTLLDLTAAYATLANGGLYVEPRIFLSAADTQGEELVSVPIREERVANEDPVYVLTNILQGVVERGTGASVRRTGYRGPAAGKTGTSNETRDAWFVGFTPTLTTGVWVGYDDNSKTGLTGGKAAAPIWGNYMKCVEPLLGDDPFVAPTGIVYVDVDPASGDLASRDCPNSQVVKEVFVRGTEPREYCGVHSRYASDEPRSEKPNSQEESAPSEKRRKRSVWDILFGG